jgi:hypothetical protein
MPVTNSSQPEPISAAQPTVEPIEATLPRSSTDWLLPVAALLLVAGGVTSFVARRKK